MPGGHKFGTKEFGVFTADRHWSPKMVSCLFIFLKNVHKNVNPTADSQE